VGRVCWPQMTHRPGIPRGHPRRTSAQKGNEEGKHANKAFPVLVWGFSRDACAAAVTDKDGHVSKRGALWSRWKPMRCPSSRRLQASWLTGHEPALRHS
jgi:hypothetical protein